MDINEEYKPHVRITSNEKIVNGSWGTVPPISQVYLSSFTSILSLYRIIQIESINSIIKKQKKYNNTWDEHKRWENK